MDGTGVDVLLVGVPIAALTALCVEAMKRAGLAEHWAPWAAAGVAVILTALAELTAIYPWLQPVARVVAAGLVLGLASSGSYSWARQMGRKAPAQVARDSKERGD